MRTLKLFFLVIAMLFSFSVGYSKLQEQLSVYSTVTLVPQEEEHDDYTLTHTLNKWTTSQSDSYQYFMELTYLGTDPDITSWAIVLDVPSSAVVDVNLFSNCSYSYSSGKITIYNDAQNFSYHNGSISKLPDKKAIFQMTIKIPTPSDYQLNVSSVEFYNLTDKPNPHLTDVNLTNTPGAFNLTKVWDNSESDGVKRYYRLKLKNTTSNFFHEFTVVLGNFDPSKMRILDEESFGGYPGANLKYTIIGDKLTLIGTNINPYHTVLNLEFYVKYFNTIIDLTKVSFVGRYL